MLEKLRHASRVVGEQLALADKWRRCLQQWSDLAGLISSAAMALPQLVERASELA
jgi:hypothetical protein